MGDLPALPSDGVLRLRPLVEADATAQLAGEDSELVRWLSGGRSTLQDQRAHVAAAALAWAEQAAAVDLGIERVEDGTLIGTLGIQSGMSYLDPGQVNLTYGLYPPWRGQGLATRAVRLAIDVACRRFEPDLLVIRVHPANEVSAAVARRLGFVYSRHTTNEDDAQGEIDWYVQTAPDAVQQQSRNTQMSAVSAAAATAPTTAAAGSGAAVRSGTSRRSRDGGTNR